MDASEKNSISVDCFIFILLLIPHFFRFPELSVTAFPHGLWIWLEPLIPQSTSSLPTPIKLFVASILMLLFICYVFVDMRRYVTSNSKVSTEDLKILLILTAFIMIIFIPTLHEMSLRRTLGPETHAHDGAIMLEEAMKMTLEGRNVYTETFYGTPVENCKFAAPQVWHNLGIETYPALIYFPYLPFSFLVPLPFYMALAPVLDWFDLRMILVPFYFAFIWLSYKIASPERKIIAVQFAMLNVFLATFLITGRNDILSLALLAAALSLLERHPIRAQIFLAFAALTKQYVWLMIPFFGLYLIRKKTPKGLIRSGLSAFSVLWPFWLLFAAGILPYFLWNPVEFLKSVTTDFSTQPIKGIGAYGFGTWVLFFGWAKDAGAKFPFLAVQIVFTAPVLLLCFSRQMKRNTLDQVILGCALANFVFFYFSRYFHDNYLGVILALLALAYCAGGKEETVES